MARRRFHSMTRSGVSIRLVPTALVADAFINQMGGATFIQNVVSNPSNTGSALGTLAQNTLRNGGGVLIDLIAAFAFTKIFPRTPGLRLGRFRVSL